MEGSDRDSEAITLQSDHNQLDDSIHDGSRHRKGSNRIVKFML